MGKHFPNSEGLIYGIMYYKIFFFLSELKHVSNVNSNSIILKLKSLLPPQMRVVITCTLYSPVLYCCTDSRVISLVYTTGYKILPALREPYCLVRTRRFIGLRSLNIRVAIWSVGIGRGLKIILQSIPYMKE